MKLRRRTGTAATVSDLPFCSMCGAAMRLDAATGRCALGHRVTAPRSVEVADVTAVIETPFEDTRPLIEPVGDFAAPDAVAGEGLYEAYQTADAAGRALTWDDVVAPAGDAVTYDDYLTWDAPASGFSSLQVDADEFPAAEEPTYEAPATSPVASDLLDELDDATYARRKAVGTIGATIAVSGAVFGSIALLPF